TFSLSATVNDETCPGDENGAIELTLNNGTLPFSFVWSDGSTSSTLNGLAAGEYTVTATDGLGCERIESFTIHNQAPGPFFITAAGPIVFCAGDSVLLNASPVPEGYIYQWYEGNQLLAGQTEATLQVDSSGAYYVRLEGPCEVVNSSNWIFVDVRPVANAFISPLNGSTAACQGDTIFLVSTPLPDSLGYQWYQESTLLEGQTDSVLAVLAEGIYYVIPTGGECENPQSNWLFVDFIGPNLFNNDAPTLCPATSFDLNDLTIIDLNNAGASLSYHSGTPADESNLLSELLLSIDSTTTIYVLATTDDCQDELPITIETFPAITAPEIELDVSNQLLQVPAIYASYQWFYLGVPLNGATMANWAPQDIGEYTVEVSNANGCVVRSAAFEYDGVSSNRDLQVRPWSVEVFPIPLQEALTIQLESEDRQILQIQISDVLGQQLWTTTHRLQGHDQLQVAIKAWPSGIYFLHIDDGQQQVIRKLVKP
ncbi:MAG: T9SS type A sorting domain-containing protein, partial [Bacteroidota bacterium]